MGSALSQIFPKTDEKAPGASTGEASGVKSGEPTGVTTQSGGSKKKRTPKKPYKKRRGKTMRKKP
jgi:hypothetical protein